MASSQQDESELKLMRRFQLNPDESVLISMYRCFYSKGLPLVGKLYIFNDCVCFSSLFNAKNLIFNKTAIRIWVKDLIISEVVNHGGVSLVITASTALGSEDHEFLFSNLGEDARLANFII